MASPIPIPPMNPNGTDMSLMQELVKAAPKTPDNVESAQNPNSILNRVHGDATRHPISMQFTRQPRTTK